MVPAAAANKLPFIKYVPKKHIIICKPNKGVKETAAPHAKPTDID